MHTTGIGASRALLCGRGQGRLPLPGGGRCAGCHVSRRSTPHADAAAQGPLGRARTDRDAYQLLIDVVDIQQHVAQLNLALAKLNVDLAQVDLVNQKPAQTAFQQALEHPLEHPVRHPGASCAKIGGLAPGPA
jgi:hypothetical protein